MLYLEDSSNEVDFALLDLQLGRDGSTSLPVARILRAAGIPFWFVSATTEAIPGELQSMPQVSKPFRPSEIEAVLPLAA